MQIVPLQAVPSQRLSVTLAGQSCRLAIYEGRSYDVQHPVLGFDVLPGMPPLTMLNDDGQAIDLSDSLPLIRTSTPALYLDLSMNDQPVLSGVPCLDGVRVVRSAYLGFVGDLMFVDTKGRADPQVTGLGARWVLSYLPA